MKKLTGFVKACFQRDFPTWFSRIAMIGVISLPLIYSVLYLWAFWDPYNKVADMPVAFVNQDLGGEKNGEKRNVGQELADKLAKENILKFSFTSLEDAQAGLASKKYYAYFLVPKDFTANILSADQANPQKAQIQVEIREATSVVGSKIIDRAASEIAEKLSHQITEEYFNNVFIQSRDTVESIKQAVDGASKLNDGIDTAKKGSDSLVSGIDDALDGSKSLVYGLDSAVSGAKTLQAGAEKAESGGESLKSGLEALYTGAVKLTNGVKAAQAGSASLDSGLQTAATAAPKLVTYDNQAAAGSAKISGGLAQSSSGAASLVSGVNTLASSLPTLQQGMQGAVSLTAGISNGAQSSQAMAGDAQAKLNQLMTQYPNLASDPNAQALATELGTLSQTQAAVGGAATQLSGVVTALSGGLTSAGQGVAQLASGASTLKSGLDTLKTGSDTLTASLTQIAQGQQQLAEGIQTAKDGSAALNAGLVQLSSGGSTLADGIDSAYGGAKDLSTGLATLASGEKDLATGLTNLDNGGWTLKKGLVDIQTGGQKLSDGLVTASSGTQELYQKLQDGYDTSRAQVDASKTDQEKPVLANPVQVDEQMVDPVQTYGTGFTPYFIPLAMWVGAISVFVIFGVINFKQAREYRFLGFAGEILRRYGLYAVLGVIQSYVLGFVLIRMLGLQPVHTFQFYEFIVTIALLFIAIMMFLNYIFHGAGPFLAVILLMLQLTSSGGTYPIETVPQFFQIVAPYMPMTYAVPALRDIISGSSANVNNILYLFWVATGLFVLATIVLTKFIGWLTRPRKSAIAVVENPGMGPEAVSIDVVPALPDGKENEVEAVVVLEGDAEAAESKPVMPEGEA